MDFRPGRHATRHRAGRRASPKLEAAESQRPSLFSIDRLDVDRESGRPVDEKFEAATSRLPGSCLPVLALVCSASEFPCGTSLSFFRTRRRAGGRSASLRVRAGGFNLASRHCKGGGALGGAGPCNSKCGLAKQESSGDSGADGRRKVLPHGVREDKERERELAAHSLGRKELPLALGTWSAAGARHGGRAHRKRLCALNWAQ